MSKQYAEQLIAAAKLQYAISLPDRFSDAVHENARLKKEIETLRALLTEAREDAAQSAGGPSAGASISPPSAQQSPKPAQPIKATYESYVVEPGDTLSRIASKHYGDSTKWDVIFEANKATLRRPESVRVGQTLVIPN